MAYKLLSRSVALLALLLLHLQVQAAQDRLLVWHIQSPTADMILLGSMHLAREGVYPLRSELLDGFAAADTLVVEIDISGDREMEVQQQLLSRGMYPQGQSLRQDVSEQTWVLLAQQAEAMGLPLSALEQMRPGMVATMLMVQGMMNLGLTADRGIDRYFLDRAQNDKQVVELETIGQQVALLLDVPEPDLFMRQALLQLDQLEQLLEPLVSAWKQGDAAALEALILDDELRAHPEFEPLFERMIYERNRRMAERLNGMLRLGGRYFVVVGAGHLVGDQGIVALLQAQNFKAKQL